MVKITAYHVRKRKDGSTFVTLELSGNPEVVQSQSTGRVYITKRTCNVPTTFDEDSARLLVGSEMPGQIIRVECEPYEYEANGEIMLLTHSYAYQATTEAELISNQVPQHSF